jgi:two-component system cell cycle response regulator CpdR
MDFRNMLQRKARPLPAVHEELDVKVRRWVVKMPQTIIKRSIALGTRKTSVSLEDPFWLALKEMAAEQGMTVTKLISRIDAGRNEANLSSALRVHVIEHFKHQASHGRADKARTVLVVDDEPLVLELTAHMLEELGCESITAHDGHQALAVLKNGPAIDIMITDINMPGLTGYELAERARRLRPGLQVILLSGRETDGHGLPLLRKPFLEPDLVRVMRETTGLCRD